VPLSPTAAWAAVALLVFGVAYAAAMAEERLRVRKSVPMLLAAAVVWLLVGVAYALAGESQAATDAARHTLLDFTELLLFLIPAMTFVNTLEERGLFAVLQARLLERRLSPRAIFWVTGGLAFVVSPVADNLTTALVLGGVVLAVGRGNPRFLTLACINVVVAANAGGAFSPFGDITTLMVWQAGRVPFADFFALLLPALVDWLVPAVLLSFAIGGRRPTALADAPRLEPGALPVLVLFVGTIALTVSVHTFLDLPPALGMMAGLGLLKGYGSLLDLRRRRAPPPADELDDVFAGPELADAADEHAPAPIGRAGGGAAVLAPPRTPAVTRAPPVLPAPRPLDVFALLEKIEWDTLLFLYGVLLCVGGLGAFGLLELVGRTLYGGSDPTLANVLVGLLSALVDNVPVMFAVLDIGPAMSQGQWLLVTLTTGVGGSLLSVGSAAGVALMGQARGTYTFGAHLRWSWAIALGYAASIGTHLLVNGSRFA
jgi:Na+/H+ antiporter NhaD/arsenite permease-like protein